MNEFEHSIEHMTNKIIKLIQLCKSFDLPEEEGGNHILLSFLSSLLLDMVKYHVDEDDGLQMEGSTHYSRNQLLFLCYYYKVECCVYMDILYNHNVDILCYQNQEENDSEELQMDFLFDIENLETIKRYHIVYYPYNTNQLDTKIQMKKQENLKVLLDQLNTFVDLYNSLPVIQQKDGIQKQYVHILKCLGYYYEPIDTNKSNEYYKKALYLCEENKYTDLKSIVFKYYIHHYNSMIDIYDEKKEQPIKIDHLESQPQEVPTIEDKREDTVLSSSSSDSSDDDMNVYLRSYYPQGNPPVHQTTTHENNNQSLLSKELLSRINTETNNYQKQFVENKNINIYIHSKERKRRKLRNQYDNYNTITHYKSFYNHPHHNVYLNDSPEASSYEITPNSTTNRKRIIEVSESSDSDVNLFNFYNIEDTTNNNVSKRRMMEPTVSDPVPNTTGVKENPILSLNTTNNEEKQEAQPSVSVIPNKNVIMTFSINSFKGNDIYSITIDDRNAHMTIKDCILQAEYHLSSIYVSIYSGVLFVRVARFT